MNWIDFKKERPEAEPRRQLWIRWDATYGKLHDVRWSDELADPPFEWSEIEPPPKPDPFEEWWEREGLAEYDGRISFGKRGIRIGWDAAMKYANANK